MNESHRLVIGPGGSGRTHRLGFWVDERDGSGPVGWISGSSIQPVDEDDVRRTVAEEPSLLVVDDLQWLTDAALSVVSEVARSTPVWASRRPWPSTERLRLLDDQLTLRRHADRTGTLDLDEFTAFVAEVAGRVVDGDYATRLHAATGGSFGLASDAMAARWDGEPPLPEALIDAVMGRVRRSGPDAVAFATVLAVEPGLDAGLAARALPPGVEARGAQRAMRAGGITDAEGGLLPIVRAAIIADLDPIERGELHDRVGSVLHGSNPDRAADHLRVGNPGNAESAEALLASAERIRRSDPGRALALLADVDRTVVVAERVALARAEASFHLGLGSAMAELDQAGGLSSQRGALLAHGLDIRELRWVSASELPLPIELSAHLSALAQAVVGRFDLVATLPDPSGPLTTMLASLIGGLEALAFGRVTDGLSLLAAAADDHDRLQPDVPLGLSPQLLASWAAVAAGDLAAAEDFAALGAAGLSAGEAVSLRLQLAYVRLLDGRYGDALDAVRSGEQHDWCGRDRLLLAILDAALARRSGDTARLRDAWRRADPVLVRHAPSWLLLDPLAELLAAGAKVGGTARIEPILESIARQVEPFAPSSPAPGNAAWLALQVGLCVDDVDQVAAGAERLRLFAASGVRSQSRADAARVWERLIRCRTVGEASFDLSEQAVVDAAVAVADGGEPWEASRLVGQAAIEVEDPSVARRLLERARSFAVEPDETDSEDPLVALGLSEREADVARLVAEGRTHKEAGAQLFISPKTVEHHVARIRQKLGANSRAELLAAIRNAVSDEL